MHLDSVFIHAYLCIVCMYIYTQDTNVHRDLAKRENRYVKRTSMQIEIDAKRLRYTGRQTKRSTDGQAAE